MKAFVTGGTGFIGSYLIKWLVDEGHDVLALKRETSSMNNLDGYELRVNWIDITSNWQKAFLSFAPDIVYNLAWSGVSSDQRTDWKMQIGNISFQQELLDCLMETGCRKFVGIGSQSEYGDFNEKIDETYPANPKTAYAASKVAALEILKCYAEINTIDWYWFRLFPLFGPHESDKWLIPSLIKNIVSGKSMNLTLGEQCLPYLYVGECAKAIGSVIYCEGKSGVYNVCANNPKRLKDLVCFIRDKIKPDFKLNFGAVPYRYGQSMYMEGATKSLQENIYSLNTSDFNLRLEQTINYYLNKYHARNC